MIIDKLTEFGTNFDLSQETGTYLFTNQIDLGVSGRNLGGGQPLYLILAVTEAFTDGGDSATVEFRLVSDDTASIHASTSTIHLTTGPLLKTALTLGKTFCLPLPAEGPVYGRYLGINAVVATAGFDSGMITAFLSLDPVGWKPFADASN